MATHRTHTCTTVLQPSWILSGTTRVSWHQKGKTRKVKPIWIYWSKRQWVAVASAGPYANLHLDPDTQPRQHPTTQFLQARCPSCCPTNSIKALKANSQNLILGKKTWMVPTNHPLCNAKDELGSGPTTTERELNTPTPEAIQTLHDSLWLSYPCCIMHVTHT